jgi:hypothetical protein
MARAPDDAEMQSQTTINELRSYASLLGEERAEQEVRGIEENFYNMSASPLSSKNIVSDAFSAQRSSKKFGRKP